MEGQRTTLDKNLKQTGRKRKKKTIYSSKKRKTKLPKRMMDETKRESVILHNIPTTERKNGNISLFDHYWMKWFINRICSQEVYHQVLILN